MAEGRDPKNPQPDDAAQQPDGNGQPPFEGWRRPSADEASQSPNVAGGWRKPDGSPLEPAASEPPAGSASASDGGGTEPRPDSPDAAPTQTGGWYRPPDAQIEDLLGGVD